MTDFEKICDFNLLYRAHLKARKGKRNKREVMAFELNLSHHLSVLLDKLRFGTYQMSGYRHFKVYEPKKRDIYEVDHVDKIVMHLLCDVVLAPRLSPHFIYDNAACQKGKGTHFATGRFTKFLCEGYRKHGQQFYVLKCDISKYFANIDHNILKKQLGKKIFDQNVRGVLCYLIDSYCAEGQNGVGLPLGNQTSQWFALFYMSGFDHFVKEQLGIHGYIRYMDDFVLIHHDRNFLWQTLEQIERFLWEELGLCLNPKTTVIKVSRGVEFLGWRFFVNRSGKVIKRLKTQSKLRYRRGLMRLGKEYEQGLIGFSDVLQSVASYDGHLLHGNAHQLRNNTMKHFNLKRNVLTSIILLLL